MSDGELDKRRLSRLFYSSEGGKGSFMKLIDEDLLLG